MGDSQFSGTSARAKNPSACSLTTRRIVSRPSHVVASHAFDASVVAIETPLEIRAAAPPPPQWEHSSTGYSYLQTDRNHSAPLKSVRRHQASPRDHRSAERAARDREALVKLEGIHHITAITGDAPQNVRFYAGTLGLRLVKKSVNQDQPTVYHLFYADEEGGAGSDITFFEYPGAGRGRAGAGMVHRIVWRVGSGASIDFWESRFEGEGVLTKRENGSLFFSDPEGLNFELRVVQTTDEPLMAKHPEIPEEHAILGFDGVYAYTDDVEASRKLFEETLEFDPDGDRSWTVRGKQRGGFYTYDEAPLDPGIEGAGTVHHVAWGSPTDEHKEWRARVAEA
ncbi:MAG: hypothetical protein GEU71_17250, partial [Actinobacteria bacterium]|nr:hypothetical protein [Actinomycetota bacterium]